MVCMEMMLNKVVLPVNCVYFPTKYSLLYPNKKQKKIEYVLDY